MWRQVLRTLLTILWTQLSLNVLVESAVDSTESMTNSLVGERSNERSNACNECNGSVSTLTTLTTLPSFVTLVASEVKCFQRVITLTLSLNHIKHPVIYLEKLKGLSTNGTCEPHIVDNKAIFRLPIDDNFYICGTTKIKNKITGSKVYYNRVIIEDSVNNSRDSIDFKCFIPNDEILMKYRGKRQTGGELPFNFTEVDFPENFMEAEVLDFTDNITAVAPYPNLNIQVRQNGVFVDTAINVQPGTPLEMIIYLDENSKDIYGLLTSFLKVTDNTSRQQEEIIILNGCSIDPYIFGNFESSPGGDAVSAKFRAFKFPESNYVMFVGTVNVCLNECKSVPCGNGLFGFGRKKRSYRSSLPPDPNKIFEVEMTAFIKVDYKGANYLVKSDSIESRFDDEPLALNRSYMNELTFVQNEAVLNSYNYISIIKMKAITLLVLSYMRSFE